MTRKTRLNPFLTPVDILRVPQVDVPVAIGGQVGGRYDTTSSQGITITQAGTHRLPYYVPNACTNLRLVYHNWSSSAGGVENTANADFPFKASLEYGSIIRQATFNGTVNPTINPQGMAISDPIGVDIAAGSWIYIRTYTSSTNYFADRSAIISGGGGFTVTTDLTPSGSAAIANSIGNFVGPCVILGTPTTSTPTVIGIGDSIMAGANDLSYAPMSFNDTYANGGRGGFLARAAIDAKFGYVNVGIIGDEVSTWNTSGTHTHRMGFARYCKTAVIDYGINDLAGAFSLATIQANLITSWTSLSGMGLRVFQTTMVPQTTSTDNWQTTGNQTTKSWESTRLALNAWLRDGAPMVSGAAVATGTSGASRCRYLTGNTVTTANSGATHPLFGAAEISDTCESSHNSGKWRVPFNTRTVTDATTTASSTTVGSATANFTTADIGRYCLIAGAGTSGALNTATINSAALTSTSMKVFNSTPATTVSGASMTILDASTRDGVHPDPVMAEAIAGVMPTNFFI